MKPFMNQKEVDFIFNFLNLGFKNILEWGSGGSTVYFPKVCEIDSWTSIEHNRDWYEKIKDSINEKVDLQLRDLDKDYTQIEGDFDLVLIDGRRREDCFLKAREFDCPILLHDSGRKRYWQWYKDYPHEIVLDGEGKEGKFYNHRGLALFYV